MPTELAPNSLRGLKDMQEFGTPRSLPQFLRGLADALEGGRIVATSWRTSHWAILGEGKLVVDLKEGKEAETA